MNILANAVDALEEMDKWGKIQNHASRLKSGDPPTALASKSKIQNPEIRIRTEVVDDRSIAVRIADNGPGMTAAVRERLFDPFFTTKPVGKGTGLGLSISYQIVVQKHKGALRCDSRLGQGAEFWIEIPLRQRKSEGKGERAKGKGREF